MEELHHVLGTQKDSLLAHVRDSQGKSLPGRHLRAKTAESSR